MDLGRGNSQRGWIHKQSGQIPGLTYTLVFLIGFTLNLVDGFL